MKTSRRGFFGMLAGLAAFGKVPRRVDTGMGDLAPGFRFPMPAAPVAAVPVRSGSWVRTLDWNKWRAYLAQLREGRA
jgi:hypothetical protein